MKYWMPIICLIFSSALCAMMDDEDELYDDVPEESWSITLRLKKEKAQVEQEEEEALRRLAEIKKKRESVERKSTEYTQQKLKSFEELQRKWEQRGTQKASSAPELRERKRSASVRTSRPSRPSGKKNTVSGNGRSRSSRVREEDLGAVVRQLVKKKLQKEMKKMSISFYSSPLSSPVKNEKPIADMSDTEEEQPYTRRSLDEAELQWSVSRLANSDPGGFQPHSL